MSVPLAHGLYYTFAGMWPLLSMDAFQKITGPKTDLWLVRTVGTLISVIGLVLLLAWWRKRVSVEIVFLAIGSAAALAAIDVYHVLGRVLSPIYLADALAETALIAGWVFRLSQKPETQNR